MAASATSITIPKLEQPVIGVIGGSGLLKSQSALFQKLTSDEVPTSHGNVLVRHGKMESGGTLIFVQRHEASAHSKYTQPADINYAGIALALAAVGCQRVIGFCSVGSLRTSIAGLSLFLMTTTARMMSAACIPMRALILCLDSTSAPAACLWTLSTNSVFARS